MENTLPLEIKKGLEHEKIDFTVQASRKYPRNKASLYSLSGFFLIIGGLFIFFTFGLPFLMGEETTFKEGKGMSARTVVAKPGELAKVIVPGFLLPLFFLLPGVYSFIYGVYALLAAGSLFVGTDKRLIEYRKGAIQSYDWRQFTGGIKVKEKSGKGNLSLNLRTGSYIGKSRDKQFAHDEVYLVGIENPLGIEKILRKRIMEKKSKKLEE